MPDSTDINPLGPRPDDGNGLGPRPTTQTLGNVQFPGAGPQAGVVSAPDPIGHVIKSMVGAVGGGLSEDQFSGDVTAALRQAKVFGPDSGQGNIVQQFNETVLRHAIATGELGMRVLGAGFAGYQAGVQQIGEEAGQPILGRDIAALPEAFMGHGEAVVHGAASADAAQTVSKARELGIVGDAGEAKPLIVGKEAPLPIPLEGENVAKPDLVPDTVTPPTDVHALARQIAPDVMQPFDALQARNDLLRQQIEETQSLEHAKAINSPEALQLQTQIGDLLEKVNGVEDRLTKKQTSTLENVRAQLSELLEPTTDSQAVSALRAQIQQNDYAMRDMAPRISAAYDEARAQLPQETPQIEETKANVEPAETTPIDRQILSSSGQVISSPQMVKAIADDVASKVKAAGRNDAESQLAGALAALHYETRARYLDGTKGTAQELYDAEGPNIVGPKGAAETLTLDNQVFNQTRQGQISVFNNAKSTIRLMKSANASTFIHEMGHQWLYELLRDASDEGAPQTLKDLASSACQWMGVEEGQMPTRPQHEKWARAFERYLYDGEAPSPRLASAFAQFRQWLQDVYAKVKGLAPISDEIKDVFDRLITPNPERQAVGEVKPLAETLADIHETDARITSAAQASHVADLVHEEIRQMVKDHPNLQEAVNGEPGLEGSSGATNEPEAAKPGQGHVESRGAGAAAEPNAERGGAGEPKAEGEGGESAESAEPTVKVTPTKAQEATESKYVDKAGNIRQDTLEVPDDVFQAIKDAANANGDFFSARRGKLSLSEQMDLKDALGMDHIDAWKIGQAFNAEQILKAREMLIESASNVRNAMARAAETGDAGDTAAFAEMRAKHIMIQEVVSGVTAEAGRALAAFRNIQGFRDAQELSKFLEETQGLDLFQMQEMAQRGRTLNDPQKIGKFINDSVKPDFKDKIVFYYVNALISGPLTHLRYSVGNAINALVRPLVTIPVASAIGSEVYLGESVAQLSALYKGAQDGLKAAAEAFRTGQSPLLPGERVVRPFSNPLGEGPVAYAISVPGRSVSAIHSFFKSLRYEQNIAGLAYRAATSEGLTGEAFDRRIAELTQRPTVEQMTAAAKGDESALPAKLYANVTQSTADALKELYMTPTEYSSAMYHLDKFVNQNLAAKLIVPFLKIGTEITKNAILEYTPVGLASKEIRGKLLGQGADADIQCAKVVVGTSLMGATSLMVMQGLATGDGPSDPDTRAVWLLSHHPNSITVGNVSIPYQGLGHLGMLMRFSANMTETAQAWDHDEAKSIAAEFFRDVTKSILDESFMRGVHDLIDAMYDEKGQRAANYIRSFATNWLPYSVGLGQVARAVDPYQRKIEDRGFANAYGILDAAQAKVPWLSEGLMPKRDVYGEPISGSIDKYRLDPTTSMLGELQTGIGRLSKQVMGVQLTPEQYDDYSRVAGRYTKARLDDLAANPDFRAIKSDVQVETIDKVIGASRRGAQNVLFAQYPDLLRQITDAAEEDVTK